jgi:diguanylate cyclase (GGDEF)-like protein
MSDPRPRILAIDDTPTNLLTLGAALGNEFALHVATSGAMGLELAAQSAPDLILLDVMMPDMDGYETCRRLKADRLTRDIPVIFVTALNSAEDEAFGLEVGAVDFISKPLNSAVVRARVRTHLTLKYQADLLRSMAFLDGLTGIANRRQFEEALQREWRACLRTGTSLALAMIDIDHFKSFNDTHGHVAGDACLRAIAGILHNDMSRPHDLIARYGGEEFACLLPDTDLEGARVKAEQLRHAVQSLGIPHEASGTAPVVTISVGLETFIPTDELTPERLVAAADAQLYKAKHAGRNRVCCAAPEMDAELSTNRGGL